MSMMYQRLHEKAVPDMFERSSDVIRHEETLELHTMLDLHDNSHFKQCEKEMFSTAIPAYSIMLVEAAKSWNVAV